jgi:hypothetical protein
LAHIISESLLSGARHIQLRLESSDFLTVGILKIPIIANIGDITHHE